MRRILPALRRLGRTLVVLVAAACADTVVLPEEPQASLTLSPSGSIELPVGQSVRVVALVQNAGDTTVRFSSSARTVAEVDAEGVVRALAPGSATIVASLAADPNVRAALAVRVPAVAPPRVLPSRVFIERLLGARDSVFDPENVRGAVRVVLQVEPGRARRLLVQANDSIVCAQDFQPAPGDTLGAAPVRSTCTFDTARFDSISGAVAFRNGPLRISARLLGAADTVLSATAVDPVRLTNRDSVIARVSGERHAFDAGGRPWNDGDLVVRAVPVVYGAGGGGVGRVLFHLDGRSLGSVSQAPFTLVLREEIAADSGGLAGIQDPALSIRVSTVSQAGEPLASASSAPIGYDNRAPLSGTLDLDGREGSRGDFVGGAYDFLDDAFQVAGGDPEAADARGVGGVRARFFVADGGAGLDPDSIVAVGEEVRTSADLAETSDSRAYAVAALVCDALENCAVLGERDDDLFGVDRTPPQMETPLLLSDALVDYVPDERVNPYGIAVEAEDDVSGFAETPLEVAALRTDALRAGVCAVGDEATDPAADADRDCDPVGFPLAEIEVETEPGYYTYLVRTVDAAGNPSPTDTLHLLVDPEAPQVREASGSVGTEVRLRASLADGLDLRDHFAGVRLESFGDLPLTEPVRVGSFGPPLGREAEVSVSFLPLRGLAVPDDDGGSTVGDTTYLLHDALRYFLTVTDHAGNRDSEAPVVAPEGGFRDFPQGLASFRLTSPEDDDGDGLVDEVLLPGDLVGALFTGAAADTPRPFARVHFYFRVGGEIVLAGTDDTPTSTLRGGRRTFAWSATLDDESLLPLLADAVVAVGVDAEGDAVATPSLYVVPPLEEAGIPLRRRVQILREMRR